MYRKVQSKNLKRLVNVKVNRNKKTLFQSSSDATCLKYERKKELQCLSYNSGISRKILSGDVAEAAVEK